MRRSILASLPAILALPMLASCGPAAVSENRTTPVEREAAPANANAVPVDPVPAASPAASAIPSALRGRWGLVPADCTSTRGDAKGLIEVSDKQIKFYESRATLGNVAEATDSRIVADFDFMGEGQTWQRRMTLEAQDDALIRSETGPDALPEPLRYTRCTG